MTEAHMTPGQLKSIAPTPIRLSNQTTDQDGCLTLLSTAFGSDGASAIFATDSTVWCHNCTIGEPSIIGGTGGGKYTLWTIELLTTRGTLIRIRRRYNDFVRLRGQLAAQYGASTYIMALPRKTYFFQDRFSSEFLEERRRGLEYWLTSVVLNPVLSGTPEVKEFVLRHQRRSDQRKSDQRKR